MFFGAEPAFATLFPWGGAVGPLPPSFHSTFMGHPKRKPLRTTSKHIALNINTGSTYVNFHRRIKSQRVPSILPKKVTTQESSFLNCLVEFPTCLQEASQLQSLCSTVHSVSSAGHLPALQHPGPTESGLAATTAVHAELVCIRG